MKLARKLAVEHVKGQVVAGERDFRERFAVQPQVRDVVCAVDRARRVGNDIEAYALNRAEPADRTVPVAVERAGRFGETAACEQERARGEQRSYHLSPSISESRLRSCGLVTPMWSRGRRTASSAEPASTARRIARCSRFDRRTSTVTAWCSIAMRGSAWSFSIVSKSSGRSAARYSARWNCQFSSVQRRGLFRRSIASATAVASLRS